MVEPLNKKAFEEKFESILLLSENQSRQGEGGLRTKGVLKHSYSNEPLISIITAVYNGEKHLEETIQSIVNQTYTNMEYIIIDGGSTDSTLEIIKKYDDKIDYWVSEKDQGISDAFNKGIYRSTGDYLLMLNSGDKFLNSDSLEKAIVFLQDKQNDIVTFQAQTPKGIIFPKSYVYKDDTSFFVKRTNAMIAHQATFVSRSAYYNIGNYSLNYKIRMDFDFFLQASHLYTIAFHPIPLILYNTDGLSSQLENRFQFKVEEYKSLVEHISLPWWFRFYICIELPFYLAKQVLSSLKHKML